ncbi:hypothetical protein D3C80_1946160 [compost metagenome]
MEPPLAADALPFEIAGEVRIHEGVGILEVDVDCMVEGLVSVRIERAWLRHRRRVVQDLGDHVSHQHVLTP